MQKEELAKVSPHHIYFGSLYLPHVTTIEKALMSFVVLLVISVILR